MLNIILLTNHIKFRGFFTKVSLFRLDKPIGEFKTIYGLNLFAFSRSAWCDYVDHDALVDEYLEGMYVSAASEIRPLIDSFHEAWNQAGEEGITIRPNGQSIILLLDAVGKERLNEIIERARAKASDERESRQVEKLSVAVRYWQMAAEVFRLEGLAESAKKLGDNKAARLYLKDAVHLCEEIIAYLPALASGWGHPYLESRWQRHIDSFLNQMN